ncbi:MAG: hypothetical protein WCM93_04410 [Bacteroidota bacterium]
MNVKDRLKFFISSQELTISAFESILKVSNGYVNSISKSIGIDKLALLIESYPNLNITWLLTGKGEMLLKDSSIEIIPRDIIACQLCIEKDRLIDRQEDVISLLKEKVKTLEDKSNMSDGSSEESSKNEAYRQTA